MCCDFFFKIFDYFYRGDRMTDLGQIQDKFSPTRINFEEAVDWLIATNLDTPFAHFASKLRSYHALVTKKIARQPAKVITDKTIDLFWTLYYNVLNCTEVTDLDKFTVSMDILSHFFVTYKDDYINKKSILRYNIRKKLTSKKYGTWLALLELADKLSDKQTRQTDALTFDFDTLLDRDIMYMHDFGIEALKQYYKN